MTLHQTEFESELNKRVERIRRMDEMNKEAEAPNLQAQTPYPNGGAVQGIAADCAKSYRPPTLREQSEKATIHHREQLDKHAKAAMFFAAHPEFDEFIQLIRQGVVQI